MCSPATFLFLLHLTAVPADTLTMPSLPGWNTSFEAPVFTPANLWDAIDGAADLFLEYNFVDLRNYRYTSPSGGELRAEMYRHATPEDAFGMYAQERTTDYLFIQVGAEGYRATGVLNFLCGCYYIKLSTNDTLQSVVAALQPLAEKIAAAIGRSGGLPEELNALPVEGRIPYSEQFIRKGFLGYPFLRSVYVARYQSDVRMFLMNAETNEKALATLSAFSKATGTPATPATDRWVTLNDAHNGNVDILVHGRWIAGLMEWKKEEARKKSRASWEKLLHLLPH
jgi:hypothetical protein